MDAAVAAYREVFTACLEKPITFAVMLEFTYISSSVLAFGTFI
jgi:hypothetical protein